jgi:hypothetical protein
MTKSEAIKVPKTSKAPFKGDWKANPEKRPKEITAVKFGQWGMMRLATATTTKKAANRMLLDMARNSVGQK